MAHHCHALGCPIRTSPEMLMCAKHWFMVPKHIRDRVWSTYRNGQCDSKFVTLQWCEAADHAVLAVATKEGKKIHPGKTFVKSFHPNKPNIEGI